MPNHDHDQELEDLPHRRSEDRVIAVVEAMSRTTQQQLGVVLAEVKSISLSVGTQAVTLGKLQQQVETQEKSLERNWGKTEELEKRVREVEKEATTSAVKLAALAAGAGLVATGLVELAAVFFKH